MQIFIAYLAIVDLFLLYLQFNFSQIAYWLSSLRIIFHNKCTDKTSELFSFYDIPYYLSTFTLNRLQIMLEVIMSHLLAFQAAHDLSRELLSVQIYNVSI